MIKEGKTPQERMGQKVFYDTTEMRILQRMLNKYCRVVEFYTEAKNPEQVNLAKKELQEVLRIHHEVKLLFQAEMEEHDGELGGLETEKVQKRIQIIKTRYTHVYSVTQNRSTTRASTTGRCSSGPSRKSSRKTQRKRRG